MRYLLFVVMTVSSLLCQENSGPCKVTLRVVDYAGLPMPYRVESFQDASSRDYASEFVGLVGRVPCNPSPYLVRVVRADVTSRYGSIQARLTIWYPETWLTLVTNPNLFFSGDRAGEVSRSVPPGHVWNGNIRPVSAERLWVQIRSIVKSSQVVETEVDADGKFRIYEGFSEGPYILHVVNGAGRVLFLSTLYISTFAPKEPLIINLSTTPPSVTVVR